MNELVPSSQDQQVAPAQHGGDVNARASDVLLHLVTFDLMGEEFGVPILDVREIILMSEVTPVPNAPAFVEGVINLRGQIIPIIDLRKRFNLQRDELDNRNRIVVVEVANNVLGLIVDGDSEVLRVPADFVKPAPALIAGGIGAEYIRGIANYQERMIILIDLHKVFDAEEMQELGEVAE